MRILRKKKQLKSRKARRAASQSYRGQVDDAVSDLDVGRRKWSESDDGVFSTSLYYEGEGHDPDRRHVYAGWSLSPARGGYLLSKIWDNGSSREYGKFKSLEDGKASVEKNWYQPKKNPRPTFVTKGKIGIAKLKGQGKGLGKKDLAQLEAIKANLEINYEISSLYTGGDPKAERAEIAAALKDVNKLISSARRKANPNKKATKKKTKSVPWSARDIKGMEEFVKRKTAKKKVAKKKPARKKTPEWQLLCNRCAKLWDHYCERPSKTRLKPVLAHLEKMKASTSKRVATERKSCLRVANKEARRLKMQ